MKFNIASKALSSLSLEDPETSCLGAEMVGYLAHLTAPGRHLHFYGCPW